jgi:hypothetical protein
MATQIVAIMYKNEKVTRRYSESYKLKILSKLSAENYNKRDFGGIYGLQNSTINECIEKYDRKDLMNTRVIVITKDQINQIKALQKEL